MLPHTIQTKYNHILHALCHKKEKYKFIGAFQLIQAILHIQLNNSFALSQTSENHNPAGLAFNFYSSFLSHPQHIK